MIPLEDSVALLLCAGLSRRYGPGNKLLASFKGAPLAGHAASLCRDLPFRARLAVVPPGEAALRALLERTGFALLENPHPEVGQDNSLRIGLAGAVRAGGRSVLVMLADMPHVDAAHLRALCAAADEGRGAISKSGQVRSPPALFPMAAARRALDHPDRPPRSELTGAAEVEVAERLLADYDRPEQFGDPPT